MTAELLAESKLRKHDWLNGTERRIPACECADGNDRTEKVCANPGCGIVKITVHFPYGLPHRKWRTAKGYEWEGIATPPCLVREFREVAIP